MGPILFQLPPKWKYNPERLGEFFGQLPGGYRYVLEFRYHSWFTADTYELLQSSGAAFCVYDLAGTVSAKRVEEWQVNRS